MRYTEDPSRLKFRTKHWQSLWKSNTDSLATLKDAPQSAFVAIDTEGYHSKGNSIGITEIGIAVLPPDVQILDSGADQNLVAFFSQNSIQSYSFRIHGKERRERQRDEYQFGKVQYIKPEETEVVLSNLFASLKDQFRNLILVGFDLGSEFAFIASNLHGITTFISSWVDLQELAGDISNTPSPSMRDTLLALGFASDGLSVRNKSYQHNAGNDAVRELAILAKLLALHESGIPLQIHRASSQFLHEKNTAPKPLRMFWDNRRPGPKELYPFTATIRIPSGNLTSIIKNLEGLHRIFAGYEPTAVGMVKTGNYGWVCLPTAGSLAQFVEEVGGRDVGGVIWDVTTDYDAQGPHVMAITPAELREAKRAEQEAQMDSKRLQRRLKRSEPEGDSLDLGLSMTTIKQT